MDDKDKKVLEETLQKYGLPSLTRVENGGRIATGWYKQAPNVYIKGRQWAGNYMGPLSENYGQLKALQINLDSGNINGALLERDGGRTTIIKAVCDLEISLDDLVGGMDNCITPSGLGIQKIPGHHFHKSGESTGFLVPVK